MPLSNIFFIGSKVVIEFLYTEAITNILSFIGISAFAASGTMVAIERKTDILGAVILASTTATGGGILRDLLLGFAPPKIFLSPAYLFVAVSIALVLFFFSYFFHDRYCQST